MSVVPLFVRIFKNVIILSECVSSFKITCLPVHYCHFSLPWPAQGRWGKGEDENISNSLLFSLDVGGYQSASLALFPSPHLNCSGLYRHDSYVLLPPTGVWHISLPGCSSSISLSNLFGYYRALVTLYNPLSSESPFFSHFQHLRAGSIPGTFSFLVTTLSWRFWAVDSPGNQIQPAFILFSPTLSKICSSLGIWGWREKQEHVFGPPIRSIIQSVIFVHVFISTDLLSLRRITFLLKL